MTNDVFDPICEIEFINKKTNQILVARLSAPIFDINNRRYYCISEILGLEGGDRRTIYSDGQFEALTLALSRFKVAFAKLTGDFRTSDGDSPHMIFPKEVPWVYGSDVYQRICNMVDDNINVIEDERTRRREASGHQEYE